MPRIVLKCSYLKGGTKKTATHRSNLVTYLATRSGVEKLPKPKVKIPSTLKQEDLIQQIITEFPESKHLFEYEDYVEAKTVENASEFITMALEQNMDEIGQRENYVDYIANRPRVERRGGHGLFTGGDDEIVLSRIVDEVANHPGNIWIPIISLRRDDAIRTGYDKAESWHNMLSYLEPEIAEAMKIPVHNFKWYAAFHNESHHPHVHMVCYSTNPTEGFLTKKGIEKMKSGLVKNIFKNEMPLIYAEQSQRREQLKNEGKAEMLRLIQKMQSEVVGNSKIEDLFLYLSNELKSTTGKKVYGYLRPNIKSVVDEIIEELSQMETVAKAYELWYELREEVLQGYMDHLPDRIPLSQQKEFKSMKNMIISEADQFNGEAITHDELQGIDTDLVIDDYEIGEIGITDEVDADSLDAEENDKSVTAGYYVEWTVEYKKAREYLVGNEDTLQDFDRARNMLTEEALSGNVLALYELGRIYANGLGVDKDSDVANAYFQHAYVGFYKEEEKKPWKYSEYRIGKMLAAGIGVAQNYAEAIHWLSLSAKENYKYAQYSLGAFYYYGHGVDQDQEKAFQLYQKAAKQGFPYADFELAKMYRDGVGIDVDHIKSEQHFKSAFQGFEMMENASHDDKLQYRLGLMLQYGSGVEKDLVRAKSFFEKSAMQENYYAKFAFAKMVLKEECPDADELDISIKFLKSIIESGEVSRKEIVSSAAYALGRFYLDGKLTIKDIKIASEYLEMSAEEDNQWACFTLGKLLLLGEELKKDVEVAMQYLVTSAERGNQYAQYLLGKTYSIGNDVPRDDELAIRWLTLSAEQGNEFAKIFLENMGRYRNSSVLLSFSRMMKHMSKIFDENLLPYRNGPKMKIDSKRLRKLKEKKTVQGYKNQNLTY